VLAFNAVYRVLVKFLHLLCYIFFTFPKVRFKIKKVKGKGKTLKSAQNYPRNPMFVRSWVPLGLPGMNE